jgi:imidazolonepropionase-like amidohydrolase
LAYPRQLALAKLFSDAGVRMMTGSDGGSLFGPGLTLQQEFRELASAGISPLKILQMTTINVAEYLGRSARMGTVETGRDANLVILDANPLESVDNLSKIAGVVRSGVHYSKQEIGALKDRIAAKKGRDH